MTTFTLKVSTGQLAWIEEAVMEQIEMLYHLEKEPYHKEEFLKERIEGGKAILDIIKKAVERRRPE